MRIAKREEEILRIKSASFHPQMNDYSLPLALTCKVASTT